MTCNKQKYQWESWEPNDCRDDWGGVGHEDDIQVQEQEPELLPKPITSLSSSILIEDAKANDLRHMFASSMFSSSKTIEDFDDISIDSDETIRMGNNSSNNILKEEDGDTILPREKVQRVESSRPSSLTITSLSKLQQYHGKDLKHSLGSRKSLPTAHDDGDDTIERLKKRLISSKGNGIARAA